MGDGDDIPVFRPKFGKQRKAPSGFRNTLLAAVIAAGVYRRRVARARRCNARVAVHRPQAGARRVIVKARFVKMTKYGAKAARLHLRYIERDGVERDGSRGVLYGAEGPVRAESFEEARAGEPRQYRIIVSPEDAAELDLTAYVRRLMAQVERDMGQRLEWAAVNHHDTEHPHAHIVVRGVDAGGREVRFDRAYISSGLRWRAQELATLELGPRTELEVQRTRAKEIGQERYTSLDREIERRAQGRVVDFSAGPPRRGIDGSTLLAHPRNKKGVYFERMIPWNGKNQLEHILSTWKRGIHRRSALQAVIFDPTVDHTAEPFMNFPCLDYVAFAHDDGGGLSLTALYATQFIFDRGYGNYLGLCRLGAFMASEMGRTFRQLTCVVSCAEIGTPSKGEARALLGKIHAAETKGVDVGTARPSGTAA